MKTWQITRRLLYQHRWLYLLLVLCPFALAAILLLPSGRPDAGDVLAILHQEFLYGLALAGFTPAAMLGNEQRSRRILVVLSRAVSRRDYLLALLCASWLPLAPYVAGLLLAGTPLFAFSGQAQGTLWRMAVAELLFGLCTASVGVFFATWLALLLASAATLALVGGMLLLGRTILEPGWWGLLLTPPAALIFFFVASAIFERRDLKLIAD